MDNSTLRPAGVRVVKIGGSGEKNDLAPWILRQLNRRCQPRNPGAYDEDIGDLHVLTNCDHPIDRLKGTLTNLLRHFDQVPIVLERIARVFHGDHVHVRAAYHA